MPATASLNTRRPLNLDDWVTPNHFSLDQFEPFSLLSVADEFDLIAPVAIFHHADLATPWKTRARQALQALKKLKHPLVGEASVSDLLQTTESIPGLQSRYNALMLALVAQEAPEAKAHIDAWGAYSFSWADDNNVLAGDSAGWFAFYSNSASVCNRLLATG